MKTSVLIFFIVLSSFGLMARYPKGQSPEHHAKGKVNALKSILNLTNQQTEKVRQIYMNHYNSRDSLKKIIVKRGPNPEVINSKLTPMFQAKELETDKKISSVLDTNQKLAYAKFVSSRKPGYIMSVRSNNE
ncbi:MAG: hypothetical protein Q8S11_03250 [Daejeonella sp.]|uniref:hypothetical protein n=1 Tax=Daejeonella sp. TaxID=2805397 RepID=UPI002735E6ED|nr:hypothetical protein [Daejeonella sp.]MDP3467324.1 hypothetical protein [Daejeonella sp.]